MNPVLPSLLITLASLTIALFAMVRAVQYPGRRSWPWWALFVLALLAALVNGTQAAGGDR